MRSTAQMISYEVSIGFIIISVLLCVGSTNLYQIILHQDSLLFWHGLYLWPQFLLFFFSAVAETNRAPFDLAEAEAELVAGYFVEYSGMAFALFFLGEYSNMGRTSALRRFKLNCCNVFSLYKELYELASNSTCKQAVSM